MGVKLSFATVMKQGLYQCCSYMVAAQKKHHLPITYGIYTDHRMWIFLKLQNNQITQSMQISLFDIYKIQFSVAAFTVFAYLMEIFDIPVNVDIESRITSITATNKTNVDTLLHLLKRINTKQ